MDDAITSLPEPLMWTVVGVLLIISGIFSAAEAALFSLGSVRLVQMEEQGISSAPTIRKLLELPRRLLVTLILGNQTANIGIVILITWIFSSFSHERLFGYWPPSWLPPGLCGPLLPSLFVSLVLVLIVAQALPKTFGVVYREGVSASIAYPLWLFMQVVFPVRWIFRSAADLLLRAFGAPPPKERSDTFERDDIKELVEAGSRDGLLDVTERELIVNLLRSGEIAACDIMTPRHEITSIPISAGETGARALMEKHEFSRIPVCEDDRGKIMGVITARDLLLLRLADHKGKPLSLNQVMRPPLFVPESRRISDLLLDFKKNRIHMALVVDEFGELSGLVTMEDVLEEIFGEVHDHDDEAELNNLGEDHWQVLGRMEIADFNTITGAKITGAGTRTLAGLVLSLLGRKPEPGNTVKASGLLFKVLEVRGIIIHSLEIKREVGE